MRLGSDPEVFLQDQAGKHISAIGFINRGKHDPLPIPNMAQGFTLQEDNVALEYGIPPASSREEFAAFIKNVMNTSRSYFPEGLSFSPLSCTIFDEDQMQHPDAHVFGCEPDYNAWTKKYNPSPRPPHPFMRSAGGHVHIETQEDCIAVIRACDLFLGVPSIIMDKGEDRKQLYGKAGAFRPKSYGAEYRTLSNFWIHSDHLMHWVWDNTDRALASLGLADQYQDKILDAINNNNKNTAEELIDTLNLQVV